jgi:Ca-activated chloride channel homolog
MFFAILSYKKDMQPTLRPLLVFIFIAGYQFSYSQNKVVQKIPEKTRILFVLDGSGSMNAVWGVDQSRMDIAKQILARLVDSLRINPNLELALRVYGHRYSRQANNCTDSKLEVPFGVKNHSAIIDKIKEIVPKGTTPITYSVLQAANDFPLNPAYRNILILITDGVESCGGDPCSVSLELQRKGIFLRPYIIGLGLQGGKTLDCMGKYIDSQDANTFNKVLNESIETTFAKTTVTVELLDGNGNRDESNVDVSFINNMTATSMYEFVHYRDRNGNPDTVQIDPVLSYNIVVNTIPPVVVNNIQIDNGKHNVISIPVAQGTLVAKPEGKGNPFSIIVRKKGQSQTLNQQRGNESYRYLVGEYEVETQTLPRRVFTIEIENDQVKTVTLPPTGLVNINTIAPGYGTLFEILENGENRWVCHLDDSRSQQSFNLLPGKYKLAFRAKYAGGSKYTAIKNFEVKSGESLNVKLFN